ncbi:O-antigen ligase family protein [Pontibacter arcticus]|nr:O-antigen ligase family protein [Pontibacter arcticus]
MYGALISSDIQSAIKDIEQKLSLFILPLVLASIPVLSRKKLHLIVVSFIVSCFVISILTFRNGLSFLEAEHRVWAMQDLILMHRPMLGLYCASCIFFILALIFSIRKLYLQILGTSLALWFFFFLIIINAKMSFLAFAISSFIVFLIYLFQRRNKWIGTVVILAFIASFYVLFLVNDAVNSFITALINFEPFSYEKYSSMMVDSFNVRFGIWKCCKEVLNTDLTWLTGTGTGDSRLLLIDCYNRNNYTVQAQEMLNAHNQYLESWLTMGLIGLVILISVLLFAIVDGIKQKQFIFYSFVILYMICAISESLFDTQKGVVIFTLFYSLFAFHLQVGNNVYTANKNIKI